MDKSISIEYQKHDFETDFETIRNLSKVVLWNHLEIDTFI